MPTAGTPLENLAQWIAATLHGCDVGVRRELADCDTGEMREVDLLIEIPHGPLKLRVIGEVRDHERPQDVRWIEQIIEKCRSVKADAAFAVSGSGFTAPARQKARVLGIRTFTLKEAAAEDWSNAIAVQAIAVATPESTINVDLLGEADEPLPSLGEADTNRLGVTLKLTLPHPALRRSGTTFSGTSTAIL